MEKEYGKLTEDQFKRFIRKLPEFRHESKDLQERLKATSPERLRKVLRNGGQVRNLDPRVN